MAGGIFYMTKEGFERLEKELETLRTVKRQEVAQRLHEALEEGDEPEENAAYETAKLEQSFVEGRIREIEIKLARAKLIEPAGPSEFVRIGSTVVVQEVGGDPERYKIVGTDEGNPRSGLISYESPLGHALLDHRPGDEVVVKAPGGDLRFRIIEVT